MKSKELTRVLAGLAVLAVLFFLFSGGDSAENSGGGLVTVSRGDLPINLTERGTLTTRNATRIRSEVRGRRRIEWMVDEGSRVNEGDLIVELEKTEVQRRIDQLENELIAEETSLNSARNDLKIQEDRNKTNLEKAQLGLEVAQVELEKLKQGDIPRRERELELAIERAESELERSEGLWKDMPTMLEKGFVTSDQYEQERIKLKERREALVTANQNKTLYESFEKPLSLKQKESSVSEAARSLEMETRAAETSIANLVLRVSQYERRLGESQEELDREKTNLSKMSVFSTASGIVFYGNPDRPWDRDEVRVGGDTYFNHVLLTIPDPSEMAVLIKVHEADIDKVQVGMAAEIRSDVNKTKIYNGEVTKIDSVANAGDRRWGDRVRRFSVEIQLRGSDLSLKPGTSAEVVINTGNLENVLHVPIQAVYAESGSFFCYVMSAGKPVRRGVKVGRSNESFLEITEGLSEGEKVLLYKPDETESSSEGNAPMGATAAIVPGSMR
jgi:HlyD family secretion protein